MEMLDKIIREIVEHYPDTQGIYLFGSFGTEDERADSDVDIALLLPPIQARAEQDLQASRCRASLVKLLRRDAYGSFRHLHRTRISMSALRSQV